MSVLAIIGIIILCLILFAFGVDIIEFIGDIFND